MKTVPFCLKETYETAPDAPAVYLLRSGQPDQTITYASLMRGAVSYSHALAEAGVLPGEVVILILQPGQALLEAFFGAVLQGAVPSILPFLTEKLSPEVYRRSLSALFETIAPAAVVTYTDFVPDVRAAFLAGGPAPALIVCEQVVSVPDLDFSTLPGFTRTPADILLLQHSSGTTGLQKGVALSHQAVFNQLESYARALRLASGDVVVSWLPLYHDMGLVTGFLLPILNRLPLVLLSPFDWVRAPYRLFQAVSRYRGTLTWMPNFAYNFCAQKVRDRDMEGVNLSSWRAVSNCAEPMSWKSHQSFL
ncbi:MAG: hypothetical protein EHM70_25875 [Chloroflexota bacterium]|nr:MAG: hypothetical protein EHM70_25875 [Chloroflexota bacterium]